MLTSCSEQTFKTKHQCCMVLAAARILLLKLLLPSVFDFQQPLLTLLTSPAHLGNSPGGPRV